MSNPILAGAAAATLLTALCGAALADTVMFKTDLKAANEVPANDSKGTGTLNVTYDTATRMLTWTGAYAGLTGPATMAHFHGPAEPGKNATVMVPSPAPTPIQGSATLTDAQAADLMGGKLYFNVHTAAHPGGEIRGQVVK